MFNSRTIPLISLFVKTISTMYVVAKQSNWSMGANDTVPDPIETFKKLYPVSKWKEAGFFTEDYINKINPYWLQFEPASHFSHVSLGVVYIVFLVVGLFGNLMVIFMFLRCKLLRTSGNILIMNLAITDGLMMVEIPFFLYNTFQEGPALGEKGCLIYGFLGGLSGCGSIMTLTSIALDRFFVIKYPLNRKYSKLRIKLSLIITWTYAIFFSSIPLFDTEFGTYVPEGLLTSCSFDYLTDQKSIRIFIFTFFSAAWLLPMTVIFFSYLIIVRTVVLKSKGKKLGTFKNESFRLRKEEEKNKQEVRLAFIIFAIIILWVVSWTPYATIALLGIFGYKNLITPMSSMLPAMFCKTASCIDPFIYALSHTKFKRELRALIFGSRREKRKTRKNQFKRKPTKIPVQEKQRTFDDDIYCNDDVEIEFIRLDSISSPCQFTNTQPQRVDDFRRIESDIDDVSASCSSWMFKPTFSNRTSSIRRLARSLSQKSSVRSRSSLDPN